MGSTTSTPSYQKTKKRYGAEDGGVAGGDDGTNSNSDSSAEESRRQRRQAEAKLPFPIPTGREYDAIDRIASELPNVIDDESRQQVEDYRQACDGGKGPMVACFATGEYLSLFERKHKDAAELYRNVCFRPKSDKSPNGVLVDNSKAYPAGCFNLAKMLMTGKGGIPYDRYEAYRIFDRACRSGHGGACYLQAQILCTRPGALGDDRIPHSPEKAMDLYQSNCDERGDSISCYTLAAMLLRGGRVTKTADNVSPQEARGEVPLAKRENEPYRELRDPRRDTPYVIDRDPKRAERLLKKACDAGSHVTSCHNLAVMYTHGDDGVPADAERAAYYKKKTQEQINVFGGF